MRDNHLNEIIEVFLKGKTFEYPLESLKSGYVKTLELRHDDYIKRLENLPKNAFSDDINKDKYIIIETGKEICDVIKIYLSGNSEKAYRKFSQILNKNRNYIEKLALDFTPNSTNFYRTRLSDVQLKDKKEIFHIPYEMRHLVDAQRYSIAGVPCLYFGNTVYGCWLELDKPDINKLFISKFRNTRNVKILDFALTFKTLLKNTFNPDTLNSIYNYEKIKSFFIIYPLILSCSFNKKNDDAKFNVEYLIPNMLLQWIANNKSHFDGIRYFSTKNNHDSHSSIAMNYVFPPQKNKDRLEGFCPELKEIFTFTAPASWTMIDSLPLQGEDAHKYYEEIGSNEKILQNVDEILDHHYGMTKFHEVEIKIDHYFEYLKLDDKHRPLKKPGTGIFD